MCVFLYYYPLAILAQALCSRLKHKMGNNVPLSTQSGFGRWDRRERPGGADAGVGTGYEFSTFDVVLALAFVQVLQIVIYIARLVIRVTGTVY